MNDLETLAELARDWYRHCRARNLATSTIGKYRQSVDRLVEYLTAENLPTTARKITHRHLARYLADLADRPSLKRSGQKISPAYVSLQYRNLQQFWKWLYAIEKEVETNPFDRLDAPRVPDKLIPVIPDHELRALLDACSGPRFAARRDAALIRVLIDSGVRVKELVGIKLEHLDFNTGSVIVRGKGNRFRVVPLGNKTIEAVRRYLRARKGHPKADSEYLFIGSQGSLTDWGARDILKRRSKTAEVKGCNPHRFRHTFAHVWLVNGGQEGDLMQIAGWKSRSMLGRYAASAASERAIAAHRKAGLGDRV